MTGLLLDFHAFPLRIKENPAKPGDAILQLGFSDGIYNRSKGGVTFSGWKCEHLPYLVELDNFGASRTPGKPGAARSGFGAMTKSLGSRIKANSTSPSG